MDSLKQFRESKGLDIDQVAKQLNVSPTEVRSWESGDVIPSSTQQQKLAELYGTSTDQFTATAARQST